MVRRNAECHEIFAVVAMIKYRRAAVSIQWTLAEGPGILFPSVLESGAKRRLALAPAQMTLNLQSHLRAADMEDKRYTLHSLRAGEGGAATRHIGVTAMGVLMEYVGWMSSAMASRYIRVTASAAASRRITRSA